MLIWNFYALLFYMHKQISFNSVYYNNKKIWHLFNICFSCMKVYEIVLFLFLFTVFWNSFAKFSWHIFQSREKRSLGSLPYSFICTYIYIFYISVQTRFKIAMASTDTYVQKCIIYTSFILNYLKWIYI